MRRGEAREIAIALIKFVALWGFDFVVYRYVCGLNFHWSLALGYLTTIFFIQLSRDA